MTTRPRTVVFHDFHPPLENLRDEVVTGLSKTQKELPPKLFYDKRGSELFVAICQLDEYYPTRTEIGILKRFVSEMAQAIGPDCLLIEYGSGSSLKIRILLDNLESVAAYVPIDISKDHLLESTDDLVADHPSLRVVAVCADYTQPLDLPIIAIPFRKKVVFFPGSTIGNFSPPQAQDFLKNVAHVVQSGGGLLIGVDLKKDEAVLNAAYNDRKGITAEFNVNLLVRINRELGANFNLDHFRHHAFYDVESGRIEMHLVSEIEQTVEIDGARFHFRPKETIHTENSYKYGIEEFQNLAREVGFHPVQVWTDPDGLFSIHYLTVP